MEKQTRSILAILSTDIPGYTEKNEELEVINIYKGESSEQDFNLS